MLLDAHVHLSLFPQEQIPTLIDRARDSHLELLCVSCDLEDSRLNLKLAAQYGCRVLIGLHPWFATSPHLERAKFEELLSGGICCGIGECGLDARQGLPVLHQLTLLRSLLELACDCKLPVNLHVRHAHNELLTLLRRFRGNLRGCVHNFTFSAELAQAYRREHMLLSVGHHLLYGHQRLRESVRLAGPEGLLFETDADFIHSGPYKIDYIACLYETAATLLGLKTEVLERIVWDNAAIFRK